MSSDRNPLELGDKSVHSMQRLLNSPESAYRSETGGLMEALRVLTVEQSGLIPFPWFTYSSDVTEQFAIIIIPITSHTT